MKILVTGGAGFIGSEFVRMCLQRSPGAEVVVLDALTYAGTIHNLADVAGDSRMTFVQGDICDPDAVGAVISGCRWVVNFAAQTHVDRSILDSSPFVRTDVEGTRVLLEAAREVGVERFLQVSTDEVYGEVEAPHRSRETDPLRPRSPYAASKAGGDLLVAAFHATYGLPTLVTRGSNTYGPYQYPEKLVPLLITNCLDSLPLPVYGDGMQQREWLHASDHCRGILTVLERGEPGEMYNLGSGDIRPNLEIVERIVHLIGCDSSLIRHVTDRPGHDRRYALDSTRVESLGWHPEISLEQGLMETVRWYQERRPWWEAIKGEEFASYYRKQYGDRLASRQW